MQNKKSEHAAMVKRSPLFQLRTEKKMRRKKSPQHRKKERCCAYRRKVLGKGKGEGLMKEKKGLFPGWVKDIYRP